MRFTEFNINEAPLPPDWDKQVYSPKTSYKKRIEYAVARAQKLGKGSARTAFIIDYQGRPTVLKVAHNHKGSIQNSEEARILDDGYINQIQVTVPLIDYDKDHPEPTWIHTEMAQKASDKTLSNLIKTPNLSMLVGYAKHIIQGWNATEQYQMILDHNKGNKDDMETFLSWVDTLQDLHYNFDINLNDFRRAANWGLYNGHPVLIDLGFTTESAKLY